MGGLNLEVFKFGLYIMFPIGLMYYVGVDPGNRFAIPDWWPKADEGHKIPHDPDELKAEVLRMKAQRLEARRRRLEAEGLEMHTSKEDEKSAERFKAFK
ncbi:MAG: hypothetical protein Q9167_005791 [Letrouitia subvulpina]